MATVGVSMLFPPSAVERAMQVKEVLLRTMNKEYSWLRAAEILGITPRGLRRLRAADGAVWVSRACRPAARPTVSAADAGGGDRADPAAVSGPLPGLQRSALLLDRPPGARSDAVVHLREADPAGSGSDQETQGAGSTPNAAGEEAPLRPDAAPGRKPPRLAGAGARREADADPVGRRCDLAAALCAAVARRDDRRGDDGDGGVGAASTAFRSRSTRIARDGLSRLRRPGARSARRT